MKNDNDKLQLTTEEKNVVMRNFFPQSATKEDMAFCMGVANQFSLNPLLNQIYFVERGSYVNDVYINKVVPMVGRDGFLTIAHKSCKFAGIETITEIRQHPTFKDGEWVEETDLVAICSVYRTDTEKPFIVEVAFKEYAGKKRNGELTKFWKEKGVTMIKKVAQSQALRLAFNVSGIYAEEELHDVNPEPKAETQAEAPVDDINAMLTEDMGGQSVDIVAGEVMGEMQAEETHEEERPAYMDDDAPKQATLELNID